MGKIQQPISQSDREKISHIWWDKDKCKGNCDAYHPNGCWVLHVNEEPVFDEHWSPIVLKKDAK